MASKSYPNKQQFNVTPSFNKTKVNSWWNPKSKTYWASKKK